LSLKFNPKGGVKMKKGYLMVLMMVFVLTLGIGLTEAQAAPDLTIVADGLMVQDLTAAGVKIFITDTTKNLGSNTDQITITRYYLSPTTAISGAVVLGDRLVPGLGHDVSNMGSNYVQIPGDTDPGVYYICAKADALNYVAESTETNNKRCKMIQVVSTGSSSLPDLIVDNLSAPSTAAPGELIYITNKIKNLGPGVAVASRARLYLSSSCAIDSSAVPLATRKVPMLAPGASNQRNTGVTIPPTTTDGSYQIVAEADAFDVNTEGNETNNVACTGITIASP
jgi:subtilase family serine protease